MARCSAHHLTDIVNNHTLLVILSTTKGTFMANYFQNIDIVEKSRNFQKCIL